MSQTIHKSEIARAFGIASHTYDKHAFVQQEIGSRLLERLSLIKNTPHTIVDIGAGTGFLTEQIQKKYPKSKIIGIDLAPQMIEFAKQKQSWQFFKNKPHYLCADAENLPFASASVDLIFSNFTFQWCDNLEHVFAECKRVLKPNGMLFFSTLGPQTLFELRESFARVDHYTHVNSFIDMHDIGDLLLNTRLSDPVVDMEMVTVTYTQVKALLKDLKATGAHHIRHCDTHQRPQGCTPTNSLFKMFKAYETFKQADNLYPATFEIIYGHAVKPAQTLYQQDKEGYIHIPADHIPILNL